MQLFRQQAIDYQQRLYGEVLLVPPLRWSVVIGLLLILLAATAAFLSWGTYSRTIAVSGVGLSGNRVALRVPGTAVTKVRIRQSVRLLSPDHGRRGASLLHATVEDITPASADAPLSYARVTARLISANQRTHALIPGRQVDAQIVLAPHPLSRWIFASPAEAR